MNGSAGICVLCAAFGWMPAAVQAVADPECDPDNGGLELPAGFCALVVADDLGAARHLAVDGDGDIYVALRDNDGGAIALRDTDGDGRADEIDRFYDREGTGILLHEDYLYFAPDDRVLRFRLGEGALAPDGEPETVVNGFPEQRSHATKSLAIDAENHLYVNVGAPSNVCQREDRRPGSRGLDPCPQLERQAGIWRFAADAIGQSQEEDGERFATGLRNSVAIEWHNGKLYAVPHGRDQLHELWPRLYSVEDSAGLPAEEFLQIVEGGDYGWPYCYYDHRQKKHVTAPEYGGDGRESDRCGELRDPEVAFPGHWAPNDLVFYTGEQFPERYRGGAFVAFHGSWNRAPLPQEGYRIVFVPFENGVATGEYETFAEGFATDEALRGDGKVAYRPSGLALGPDGSLYISEDNSGRIWRVFHRGAG
ncbi:MAG: PQQ-dependent sugar dehydrogenase [Gammaproteobacteria bacterium]